VAVVADFNQQRLWPLFDLAVKTPRLELRYATDELLERLAGVATDVISPGTQPFDGDATFYDPTPAGRLRWLTGQWGARAKTSPSWWVLVFAVIVDGMPVGTQEITASQFSRLRTVSTFSWLTRSHQGRRIGREMREAVLHLAFAGLGAERATSEAFEDNAASNAVSRAVGYEANGVDWALRQGQPARMSRFIMTRERWLERRRDDIVVEGLERCLPLLGL
jgi:RimJ/RimL family protein N-acetyltransferase